MSLPKYFVRDQRNQVNHLNYYYFQEGFTKQQVKEIIAIGETFPKERGTTVGHSEEIVSDYRVSDISWIPDQENTRWVYEKIAELCKIANREMWNFDIWDYYDSLQYTTYYGDGGHYDWHADLGPGISNRKISCVVQLSEPDEYEGGDLEMNPGGQIIKVPRGMGLVTFFPSFLLHRVKPLTAGTRRSLVTWLAGANFR